MKALTKRAHANRLKAGDAVTVAIRARGFCVEPGAKGRRPDVVVADNAAGNDIRAPIVINPRRSFVGIELNEASALLLHLHGIPVDPARLPRGAVRPADPPPQSEGAPVHIHVADLRVLALEDERGALRTLTRFRYHRLVEMACRAVYVLGLHFACVGLKVRSPGNWYVEFVDPSPTVGDELASAYGSVIADMLQTWASDADGRVESVLGADPEFALVGKDGKLLYASHFVKHAGMVGYDRQSRANRGAVYPLAELRPNPSPSPSSLVDNIRSALGHAGSLLPVRGALWLAGSYPYGAYPTGGHIHFSGASLSTPFLQALDNFLGIPVMLLEDRNRAKRRRRRYGRIGDVRRKEHGGFEYRVLPSWILGPEAALATLCLAKVVAAEWPFLCRNDLGKLDAVKDFYLARKERFRAAFPLLWRIVRKTREASAFERELSYFQRMHECGAEWQEDKDIKATWRL